MNFGQWLLLEERLRQSPDIEAMQLTLVNLLHQVFPHKQAILFKKSSIGFSTKLASHITEVDEQSKSIIWLNTKLYPWLTKESNKPSYIANNEINIAIDDHYKSYAGLVYIPINSPKIGNWGIICWITKDPSKELLEFLPIIKSTIIHAWEKLIYEGRARQKHTPSKKSKRIALGVGIALFIALFFIRVNQSTLAPAEISPQNPLLIAPSLNGVINKIVVQPNDRVSKGQLLFQLDDISIRNKLEESEQEYKVASQRYLKAYRHAFTDKESLHEIKILKEDKALAKTTYDYQKMLLERTNILSPKAGVILYSAPKDWLGKPVKVGERVMLLANENDREITFWVPVDNMLDFDKEIIAKFFPNENPVNVTEATIKYVNPIAEPREDGTLAYFGVANLNNKSKLRLGEQGTIKLYGKKVSLGFYIFRRPIRWIRQNAGI